MLLSIEDLLELARILDITVKYRDLHNEQHPDLDGYADVGQRLIVLDMSLKDKPRHHKCVLVEEIGHIMFPPRPGHIAYHMKGYCKLNHSDRSNIAAIVAQDERKALRWATNILMPDNEIERAKANGVNTIHDLMDWFNVEEWFAAIKIGI